MACQSIGNGKETDQIMGDCYRGGVPYSEYQQQAMGLRPFEERTKGANPKGSLTDDDRKNALGRIKKKDEEANSPMEALVRELSHVGLGQRTNSERLYVTSRAESNLHIDVPDGKEIYIDIKTGDIKGDVNSVSGAREALEPYAKMIKGRYWDEHNKKK